ncbi:MAG TPA: molybdopterin molybdotransferase MoeA [Sphingopyxis sp.]|jgi:molybdopterin molybdotransferase|uniref:molybdopterin molybdotransferase MoeA n=1 Tax=unclassified Sphingopyxis TaxID=2614943 RepID=UPI00109E0EC1|nr:MULTISPECIES: molybdopterin molybdotransferase MoeA [unclassified Sphingopyxis]QCB56732.1 molybdopterin molybdotransferase MoeA [Sphingopyxis sp. PAMC25046]HWW55913.1 molybdopterin molybdotransferase MoeA [Sphingopyxis sp.]
MTKLGTLTDATECAASISYDTALAILAALATPLDAISLSLTDAGGCYLAKPVHARLDSPRFDCAAMDGYAVRASDLENGSSTLTQVGTSYAGSSDAGEIGPGQTMRVMTGAPLPHGADRVVMIEYCRQIGSEVTIAAPPRGKPHIRRRGSDFARGQQLLPPCTKITPATVLVAAAGDHGQLSVTRRPRIQLLATGDEIFVPGSAAAAAFPIPDSLTAAIDLMCRSAGAEVVSKARLSDDPKAIASAKQAAEADIIVVVGGASRGDRDFGRGAFAPLGLKIAFADVDMKPGKPVWYGTAGAAHILGLPGNPAAALTIARLFLVPLITRLMGGDLTDALPWQLIPATAPIEANGAREAFLCAATSFHGVTVGDRQDASGQARLAHSNALVRRRARAAPVLPGMLVPTLPLCC